MDSEGKLRVADLWFLTSKGLSLILRDERKDLWPAVVETVDRLNQEVKTYVEQQPCVPKPS